MVPQCANEKRRLFLIVQDRPIHRRATGPAVGESHKTALGLNMWGARDGAFRHHQDGIAHGSCGDPRGDPEAK